MKYENKNLTLMIWNDVKGKYEFFILDSAVAQISQTEFFVTKGNKIGEA